MLKLTRRLRESVIFTGEGRIEVTVVGMRGNRVELGIDAPPTVRIQRDETINREDPSGEN